MWGEGVLGCRGGGGEGPPAVLGARPTSGGTRPKSEPEPPEPFCPGTETGTGTVPPC